jgi:hypothetical protein
VTGVDRPPRIARLATIAFAVVATLTFAFGIDGKGETITRPRADAAYYYAYLPSLVLDRDVDFTDEYKVVANFYRFRPTPTGKPGNVFGIGPAIFAAPAFVVGHGVALVTGARDDGYSRIEECLVLWMSILATAGALWCAYRLCRRRVGGELAAYLGPVVAIVAGPVFYYAVRQPGYAHPFATFFVALLVERWDASYDGPRPRSLRTWIVLGLCAGAAVLARPQLAPWGLVLVAALVDDLRHRGDTPARPLVARWAVGGAAAFVAIVPQLAAWKVLYGSWLTVPQGDGFMRWDAVAWSEVLFSSRNGLFPWAPLYLPMLVGVVAAARRHPRLVIALVLGLAAQAAVNGAAWDWWAGGSYGGRRFDSTYIVFAFGGAVIFDVGLRLARRVREPGAGWRDRGVAAAVALVFAAGALIGLASIELAMRTAPRSARIFGGEAAARLWARIGGLRGELAAQLSFGSNLPSRIAFAVEYDTSLDAYDRLVGTHFLGETYPGLNATPDKLADKVPVSTREWRHPRFTGLRRVDDEVARMTAPTARILVGLNRRGEVALAVPIRVEAPATIRLRWNGATIAEQTIAGAGVIEARTRDLARGINALELEAPVGTLVSPIDLHAGP